MKRLLVFTLRLAVLLAVVLFITQQPGTAHIVWRDYEIETSAAFLCLGILAFGFVLYLLFRLGHFLKYSPERWRINRQLRHMKQGQALLTQGLIAVAGGDAAEAGRLAVTARKKLGVTTATLLLQAQAAQLAGDHRAAQEIFRALSTNPDSTLLGYRGLIMEARRAQDWAEVEKLTEELQRLKPKTPWLNLIRFEILVRRKNWIEAEAALSQAASSHLIDTARSKQYRAALLVAQSQRKAHSYDFNEALQAAEKAVKQAPDSLPALLNLVQQQLASKHPRAMRRTVEKNWARYPHPQLAVLYRSDITDPMEAYKQIEALCHNNPEAPTSYLVQAEAALNAKIWGEARRHLAVLIDSGKATQAAYRLMARLERLQHNDERAALSWLTRSAEATPDPVWLCHSCGESNNEWKATCTSCGSFDTLDWQSPGVSRTSTTTAFLAHD